MALLACVAAGEPPAAISVSDLSVSDLPVSDRDAIRGVIGGQMEAFKQDDAKAAFAFAAPFLQQMFGDPATFMEMVRRGYAPVYRPHGVTFGALVDQAGHPVQRVELIGPDGQPRLALYTMEREADGTWRIAGCELTESEAVGA